MTPPPLDLVVGPDGVTRCGWCVSDASYVAYHDEEWGRPVHDEYLLFEKLCLEGFQAGLSWLTVLRKRPAFRRLFAGFDPAVVAEFDDDDIQRLLTDTSIIRHRGKIDATVANARAVQALHAAGERLDEVVWSYAPPVSPPPRTIADLPATTPESVALSGALKQRGFRFVGPTTAYAFMQAMGLVDDHLLGCDARGAVGIGNVPSAAPRA